MDTEELLDELRAADHRDTPLPDVDRLVTGAIRTGRRRVFVRRAAGVGTGLMVTATLAAVVVSGLPSARVTVAPAATPTASSRPSASPSEDPTTPAPSFTPGRAKVPTQGEVFAVIRAGIPHGVRVKGALGGPPDVIVTMTLTDDEGYTWAGGGIQGSGDTSSACEEDCTQEPLAGGTFTISRDTEKVGDGVWYSLERSDGRVVWFGQRAAFEGNGPTTRDGVILTTGQVKKLLTAPAWDALAERCDPESVNAC